jgi:enolase
VSTISKLTALEILDSRGRPTVQATCTLGNRTSAKVSVPAGASTGRAEALELRDGDMKRFRGLGCQQAVQNIRLPIAEHLQDKSFSTQAELDEALITFDGTPNKSRLGANAVLAVSLAFARAQAAERRVPLYEHFASLLGVSLDYAPRLTINLFSGGKHAGGQVVIQDVLLAPLSSATISDSLAMAYEVVQCAAAIVRKKYKSRPLKADEGGLAPDFPDETAMIEDAVTAIEQAGLKAGEDVALAIDVASSHFYEADRYQLNGRALSGVAMVELLCNWTKTYPIISVEDGLAEEDWTHWALFKSKVKEGVLILGDDLLCTRTDRIRKAKRKDAANALLLKVNQVGTLTEAAAASKLARADNWQVVVSARSGETEDDWLADLAVGWQGNYIKVGSVQQSERLAKYNRLLAIEAAIGLPLRGA